jgi:uncharacterized membrane protein YkvA (DUF1232 family)
VADDDAAVGQSRLGALRSWAKRVKLDIVAVYFAARDPRTPVLVRILALSVAAYALSPIDLIPDFIPVIGYLDDLVIVPLGLMCVLRLIPPPVLAEARARAAAAIERPSGRPGLFLVVAVWIAAGAGLLYWWTR